MLPAAVAEERSAQIIDGKATAAAIREELKTEVDQLKEKYGKVGSSLSHLQSLVTYKIYNLAKCSDLKAPGLAVVLVGSRGDSETYVRSMRKACEEVGIKSFGRDLPEDVSQEELLKVSTSPPGLRHPLAVQIQLHCTSISAL